MNRIHILIIYLNHTLEIPAINKYWPNSIAIISLSRFNVKTILEQKYAIPLLNYQVINSLAILYKKLIFTRRLQSYFHDARNSHICHLAIYIYDTLTGFISANKYSTILRFGISTILEEKVLWAIRRCREYYTCSTFVCFLNCTKIWPLHTYFSIQCR